LSDLRHFAERCAKVFNVLKNLKIFEHCGTIHLWLLSWNLGSCVLSFWPICHLSINFLESQKLTIKRFRKLVNDKVVTCLALAFNKDSCEVVVKRECILGLGVDIDPVNANLDLKRSEIEFFDDMVTFLTIGFIKFIFSADQRVVDLKENLGLPYVEWAQGIFLRSNFWLNLTGNLQYKELGSVQKGIISDFFGAL
jgi:hypothetical protein